MLENRKIILFIVEGKNDQIELQTILRARYDSDYFRHYIDRYLVIHGDLLVKTKKEKIVKTLNDLFVDWRQGKNQEHIRYQHSDICRIIQITDTDGVFIPDSSVIEADEGKVRYLDDSIRYLDRNWIIGRNRKKAGVIKKLIDTDQIDQIEYKIFFASCNMEHVLFDVRENQVNEKSDKARQFSLKCKSVEDLSQSILAVGVSSNGTYMESWEMIQKGHNSLQRHTNLNILLDYLEQI